MRIYRSKLNAIFYYGIMLFPILFIQNVLYIAILYIIVFTFSIHYIYKINRIPVTSIYSIVFLLFNAYVLIPAVNFIFLKKAIYVYELDYIFKDPEFYFLYKYLINSIIGISIFSILSSKVKKVKNGLNIKKTTIYILFSIGILLFLLQLFITKSYNLINTVEFRYKFFSLPTFYDYFLYPAIYFSMKNFSLNKMSKLEGIIFSIFILLYAAFWTFSGFRGLGLVILIIGAYGYLKNKELRINLRFIFSSLFIFAFFIFFTLRLRMSARYPNPTFHEMVQFAKENPKFINPGTVEYGTSYYNYAIMKKYNFQEDYPFQTLVEGFTKFFPLRNNKLPLFYKYRDQFFPERAKKSGKSGGTGFSLQYEFEMHLGEHYFFIMYFIFGLTFMMITKLNLSIAKFWEIYVIFLIPIIRTVARSNFSIAPFITKFIYSIIIYYLILIINQFLFRKKIKFL